MRVCAGVFYGHAILRLFLQVLETQLHMGVYLHTRAHVTMPGHIQTHTRIHTGLTRATQGVSRQALKLSKENVRKGH